MVDQLVAAEELTDPAWRAAFTDTPRHVFVPEHPLADAYSQDGLVTQWRPTPSDAGDGEERPTSSASAPGVVAVMLDRLDVKDDQRVLEIGTGTGYNTGLLCYRLGAANVWSVDIDPALIDRARSALQALGYEPNVVAGDGYAGLAAGAPYDRILATCAVTHVPPEWIRQLADGGRIVAPVAGNSAKPLLILDKTAPDEVTGRFDRYRVGFMPLRPYAEDPLGPGETTAFTGTGMAHYGATLLNPRRIHDASAHLLLFCQLHLPGLRTAYEVDPNPPDRLACVSVHTAHAMAEVGCAPADNGRWPVVQRGPHRIWDTVETAVRVWDDLGEPDVSRLGVSALDDVDRQYVWLDDPEGPYSWPMPL